MGHDPETFDPTTGDIQLARLDEDSGFDLPPFGHVAFNRRRDLMFELGPALPLHANGMRFTASAGDGTPLVEREYYSVGGGFVLDREELAIDKKGAVSRRRYPYPFNCAHAMLDMGKVSGLSIADMKRANEREHRGGEEISVGLDRIWQQMSDCIDAGLSDVGSIARRPEREAPRQGDPRFN